MEALPAHRLVAVALTALAVAAPVARADGDPASDVLISQPAFFPYTVTVPQPAQDELTKAVASAREKGYTVRVALIAHTYDMGTAVPLWQMPKAYAKFLAQELANFNSGWVLTVMPNGYGIFHCVPKKRKGGYSDPCEGARPAAPDERLLATLPKPGDGPGMATAATTAVERLAGLHGANPGSGGSSSLALPIGAGVGALLLIGLGVGIWRLRSSD